MANFLAQAFAIRLCVTVNNLSKKHFRQLVTPLQV